MTSLRTVGIYDLCHQLAHLLVLRNYSIDRHPFPHNEGDTHPRPLLVQVLHVD
jgi:hypothetical protein